MPTFITFGNLDKRFPTMVDAIVACMDTFPLPVKIQAGANINMFLTLELSNQVEIFDYCENDFYEKLMTESSVIITHGGVGAISLAISMNKYPAVFARQSDKAEHINDHQVEFVNYYKNERLFYLCNDHKDLLLYLHNDIYQQEPSRNKITEVGRLREDLQRYLYKVISK